MYMLLNIFPYRVVYIFGESVKFPIEDITPTFLSNGVLSTLRQADYLATRTLHHTRLYQGSQSDARPLLCRYISTATP